MNYIIQQTMIFVAWHASVRDLRAKVAIARRIDRASAGNLGDIKPVGDGVSEMRVDVGAGYRATSLCETVSSLCFWLVVTNLRKPPISGGRKNWQRRFKHEPDFDYFRYGGAAGQ